MQQHRPAGTPGFVSLANPAFAAVLLGLLVLALRVPTFVIPVINGDETIYAIVASQMRAGFWPYETAFDHKPIGLYYQFALAQMLGGDTYVASRSVGVVAVAAGAVILHWMLLRMLRLGPVFALLLTVAFVLASSGLGGNAANTEIIVNAWTLAWLALMLADLRRPDWRYKFAAGGLAGVSFQANYLTGFLLVGLALGVIAAAFWTERARIVPVVRRVTLTGCWLLAGFVVTVVLHLLPLALWGDLFGYFAEQASFLQGYHPGGDNMSALRNVADIGRAMVPIVVVGLFFVVLGVRRAIRSGPQTPETQVLVPFALIVGGVLLGSAAAALASGHFYDHYFLFLLPALFALVGVGAAMAGTDRRLRALVLSVILGSSLWLGLSGFLETARGGVEMMRRMAGEAPRLDRLEQVAQAGLAHVGPGALVYVGCGQPVLYQLMEATPATRFFYYLHHMNRDYTDALGITPEAEVQQALSREPDLVILSGNGTRCPGVSAEDLSMLHASLAAHGYNEAEQIGGHRLFLP